jgi:exodeoxyribonuclease V gamma subunit
MLTIHRAERADRLVDVLAGRIGRGDPFAPEVVAVPTRGIERWVTQRLSLGPGVCANVRFPSPRAVVVEAVARASGIDPREDPWRPGPAAWVLGELIAAHAHEPWLGALRRHLARAAEPDGRRLGRRAAAGRPAGPLRPPPPGMVLAWAAGALVDDEGPRAAGRTSSGRRGCGAAGRAPARTCRTPRRARRPRCSGCATSRACSTCPDALSLFGITRLPAADLRVVRAIAERRDVHLLLLHRRPRCGSGSRPRRRRCAGAGPTRRARRPSHPLLGSWGHDVRELQLLLGTGAASRHHPARIEGATLLERLQREIQADASPGAPRAPGPDDRSVQIHACHGRARQVEVLRDCILGLMADDPTLEPRDVLVMCPDIEDFAPLISATFGAIEGDDDRPDLRVRLADRSVRQTNPVLGAVSALLGLVAGRAAASSVLDLADREPVRRRFGFDDDDLGRLERWVADTGVRWGIEAGHRAPFRLDVVPDGTWRAGLDRTLLGAAVAEEGHRLWRDTLPLDDVDSGAIDLAGRFAELVDRLDAARDALTVPQPMAGWARAIAGATDALTATSPSDAWQRAELHRILDDLVRDAGDVGWRSPPRRSGTSSPTGWPAARPGRTSGRAP